MGKVLEEIRTQQIGILEERKAKIQMILKYNERMSNAESYIELRQIAKEFKAKLPEFEMKRYLEDKRKVFFLNE